MISKAYFVPIILAVAFHLATYSGIINLEDNPYWNKGAVLINVTVVEIIGEPKNYSCYRECFRKHFEGEYCWCPPSIIIVEYDNKQEILSVSNPRMYTIGEN